MKLVLPTRVSTFEVAPRDGFQNERKLLTVEQRIAFIDRLSQAGFRDIEVGSFVSPRWIPQLADTREVLAGIQRRPGTRYWALAPNWRGLEDAIQARAEYIAVFMSVSQAHNLKNVNRKVKDSLRELTEIIQAGRKAGMQVRAYLSTVFGCPYEGATDVDAVVSLSGALLAAGACQISLGDTIGVAHPNQVMEIMSRLSAVAPPDRFALHFHDTRGVALTNVLAGMQAGVNVFDSSMSGIGGCPYAPGATGNLATEDLLNLLVASGIEVDVDLEEASECGLFLESLVEHGLPGRYHNYFASQCRLERPQTSGGLSCKTNE